MEVRGNWERVSSLLSVLHGLRDQLRLSRRSDLLRQFAGS